MTKHPKKERTLVIIKPDGVQRSLIGEIAMRLERSGLKFIGLKMILATEKQALNHYAKDEVWMTKVGENTIRYLKEEGRAVTKIAVEYGRGVLEGLVKFLTCSPIVVICLEGNQAVALAKKIVGGTEPLTSEVGTIRGDLTLDSYGVANADFRAVRNLVHCSDKVSEAEREIKIWFKEGELVNYTHISERMLYDVNLDGFLE